MIKNSALVAETNEYASQLRATNQFKIVGAEPTRADARTSRAESFDNYLVKLQTVALSLVSELKALGGR